MMEMMGRKKKNIRWNTMGILAGGFLGVILLGGMLLWMPFSNRQPIEFMDALFTSVSAVCVTGLVFTFEEKNHAEGTDCNSRDI